MKKNFVDRLSALRTEANEFIKKTVAKADGLRITIWDTSIPDYDESDEYMDANSVACYDKHGSIGDGTVLAVYDEGNQIIVSVNNEGYIRELPLYLFGYESEIFIADIIQSPITK